GRVDLELRVVAPFVGVADLAIERIELDERLRFRVWPHPWQLFDPHSQLSYEIVDDRHRARLGFRREFTGDEFLTEQLAERPIGCGNAPLPPRENLGCAG